MEAAKLTRVQRAQIRCLRHTIRWLRDTAATEIGKGHTVAGSAYQEVADLLSWHLRVLPDQGLLYQRSLFEV